MMKTLFAGLPETFGLLIHEPVTSMVDFVVLQPGKNITAPNKKSEKILPIFFLISVIVMIFVFIEK